MTMTAERCMYPVKVTLQPAVESLNEHSERSITLLFFSLSALAHAVDAVAFMQKKKKNTILLIQRQTYCVNEFTWGRTTHAVAHAHRQHSVAPYPHHPPPSRS